MLGDIEKVNLKLGNDIGTLDGTIYQLEAARHKSVWVSKPILTSTNSNL